jgi:hypothetical protein
VALGVKPSPGAAAGPFACTLERDAVPQRIDDWRRLFAHAVRHERRDDGVVVTFPPGVAHAASVAELAAAENSCCSFFSFTIAIDHTGTTLMITTPADASELAAALFGEPT